MAIPSAAPAYLERLEAMLQAATPVPWFVSKKTLKASEQSKDAEYELGIRSERRGQNHDFLPVVCQSWLPNHEPHYAVYLEQHNADFIVALANAAEFLIREARAAARMREALKPFAERAKLTDETYYPPMAGTQYISVTLDECRIAAATLEESTP